jgi:L-histidine N-alpha-methyltransferase
MSRRGALEGVTLFDINRVVLAESIRGLSREFPGVEFQGIAGDFERDLARLGPGGGRLVVFLAGTIGNLAPEAVPGFLRSVASQMAPGDAFLVGVDLLKDPARLHAAYNDAAGVTARFNRNILRVVNRRFDADFDPEAFEHRAFFDAERAWIEMRLVARRATRARVGALARVYEFRVGDEIRTEISCKYSRESFERRTTGTGLAIESWTTDPERLFALALLKRGSGTLPA